MSQGIDRNIQGSRFRRAESCRLVQTSRVHKKEAGTQAQIPVLQTDWRLFPPWDFCLHFSSSACIAVTHLFGGEFWTQANQRRLVWKATADGLRVQIGFSQWLWGSAAAVALTPCEVHVMCSEAVTDLRFLCRCLGRPVLSNLPHVWALCAAFESMFPCCNSCFLC